MIKYGLFIVVYTLVLTSTLAQIYGNRKHKIKISLGDLLDQQSSGHFSASSSFYVNTTSTYLTELLQKLDPRKVSRLELEHVPNETVFKNMNFEGFSSLSVLCIRKSRINYFPKSLFMGLNNLQYLDISNNELKLLTMDLFDYVTELNDLILSHNNLTNLPNCIFQKLFRLKRLKVASNKLQYLSQDVFVGLKKLKGLVLSSNAISYLDRYIFYNLNRLLSLDLSINNLIFIPSELFAKLDNLSSLRMTQTFSAHIITLPPNLFSNLGYLETLEMNRNKFQYLPYNIFHNLERLKQLNLASNKLTSLSDSIFEKNIKLRILNLEDNELKFLGKNLFSSLSSLSELYVGHNGLTVLHPQIFSSLIALRVISIVNNQVNMSGPRVNYSNLCHCRNITHIYASNNAIPTIYDDWLLQDKQLEVLDLRYNPISQSHLNISLIPEKSRIDLTSNNFIQLNIENLQQIELNADAVDYFILDKNQTCGSNCACVVKVKRDNDDDDDDYDDDGDDKRIIIHCTRFNEDELELKPLASLVKWLYVNAEVILSNCNLSSLYPVIRLLNQVNVTKLSLSSNRLSSLDGLPELPKLKILELHDNKFTYLDSKILDILNGSIYLTNITLHDNPWNCDCGLMNFFEFVKSHQNQIFQPNNIICYNKNKPLLELSKHEICHLYPLIFITLCVSMALFGFLSAILISFYHKYEMEIKVWIFSHKICRWLVTENEIDRDKKYDAFVSYSHQDEWFVFNELVANLENGEGAYKLCLHYRDWLVGDHIPSQIYRSVTDSRRTIIVLSPNFLTSYWARKEFQEAYIQAMKERCFRVIIVMLEDVEDRDKLDDELKAYITSHTYLEWGDPWFWKKLKYALPHKRNTERRLNVDVLLP